MKIFPNFHRRFNLLGFCCLILALGAAADESLDQYYDKYAKILMTRKYSDEKASCIVKELRDENIAARFSADTLNSDELLAEEFDAYLEPAEKICKKSTPTTTTIKSTHHYPSEKENDDDDGTVQVVTILLIVGAVLIAIAVGVFCWLKRNGWLPA